MRGRFFDRTVRVRFDAPVYVRDPAAAIGGSGDDGRTRFRWAFSLNDLW